MSAAVNIIVGAISTLGTGSVRRLIGIAGPPAAGKTSTASAVAAAIVPTSAVVVSMDGFHLANEVLVARGLRDRKGHPDTFDAAGFVELLDRLRRRGPDTVFAPRFDRGLEESIGSAVPVAPAVEVVLVEGNYLLLDDVRWAPVAEALDAVYYLEVPHDVRMARLRQRHTAGHGLEAAAWIERVDRPNTALVEATRHRATLVVAAE